MKEVLIAAPQQIVDNGWPGVAAQITAGGRRFDIFFRASRGPLTSRVDPFVPVGLLPAMALGVPLRIEGGISPRLLANLEQIQEILSGWYPALKKIPVEAEPAAVADVREPGGTGCFFSAGIDSFYSALKHSGDITYLVFVHGFDVRLRKTALRGKVAAEVRQAAAELGKPLLEVETNLRDLLDRHASWNKESHGAGLAAVALLFPQQLSRMYVAATFAEGFFPPHASHPLLDPLWGTEELAIVHDGTDANRWQKLASMAGNPIVLRHIHSCWENRGDAYNCGECFSCLQSMAVLRLCGVADKCRTYPPLNLDKLRNWRFEHEGANYFPALLLEEIRRKGTDPELEDALHTALQRTATGIAMLGTVDELRLSVVGTYAKYTSASFHLLRAEQRVALLEAQLRDITTSDSWSVTRPLRAAAAIARRITRRRKHPAGVPAKGMG